MKDFYKTFRILWSSFNNIRNQATLALLVFFSSILGLNANDIDPELHPTGAIPLTEIQLQEIEKNWPRILGVRPNKYGAARIQEHLDKQGLFGAIDIALTPEEEFITNKNISTDDVAETLLKASAFGLPPSVDNSKLSCFPPIGDQKKEGSCVGWASTYYHATHEYGLLNSINNKSSNANIRSPKWTYNMINWGRDGGSLPTDAYALLSSNGATSIANFPYDGTNYREWDLKTDDWVSALNYRMAPAQFIKTEAPKDIETIKQILNNGHVVTFVTYAYSWQFSKVKADPSASSNPYAGQQAITWMNGQQGGHHVTIVGYDDNVWVDINNNGRVDAGEKGAFLCANSWGQSWGNNGFVWISYDAFYKTTTVPNGPSAGRVPLAEMFYSVVPKAANYKPKLLAKFSLTQAVRNQLSINAGVSNTDTTTPTTKFTSAALTLDGGAYAFDGSSPKNMMGTFVLDLTDLIPKNSINQRYYLIASDSTQGNATTLNAFSLVDKVHNKEVANQKTPLTCDKSTISPYIDYNFADQQDPSKPVVTITSPEEGTIVKDTINITVNASDDSEIARVEIFVDSELKTTDTSAPYMLSLDTTKLSDGEHKITAVGYDSAGNSAQSVVTITVQNKSIPQEAIYINAGGTAVKDRCIKTITWQADEFFTGGQVYTNTSLPTSIGIYRSERSGNFNYNIPVSNGDKKVILKFAEIIHKNAGQRIFHVNVNGKRVISNLDILKKVGFGNPYQVIVPVSVTNNRVKVEFVPVMGSPKISAIGVVSAE